MSDPAQIIEVLYPKVYSVFSYGALPLRGATMVNHSQTQYCGICEIMVFVGNTVAMFPNGIASFKTYT